MRKETVLYRDETGRGWRMPVGAKVPAHWLTDAQYRTKWEMEHRMVQGAPENRSGPRPRRRPGQPEGPS